MNRKNRDKLAREKREIELRRMLTIEACTFPCGFSKYVKKKEQNSQRPIVCCKYECTRDYSVHYIRLIRYHFSRLPKNDRRALLRELASKEEDKERYTYNFPTEDALKCVLMSTYPSCVGDGDIEPPRHDHIHKSISVSDMEFERVCKKTLLWILLESTDRFLYATKKQRTDFGVGIMAFEEDYGIAIRRDRDQQVVCLARKWLKEAKNSHLCRPDDNVTVLPWKTKMLTHAAFATETEKILNCDWVGENVHDEMNVGGEDYEEEQEDIHEHFNAENLEAIIEDNERASGGRTVHYRYGNHWLGKRGVIGEHEEIASYSHFLMIWRTEFKGVRVRKWLPFSKCDTCWDLRTRGGTTTDVEAKKLITEAYRKHLNEVKRDREVYQRNKERARLDPTNYLSLTIDAADNSDHGIPYMHDRTKVSTDSWKHRMHVIGVLAHGHGAWAFTCPNNVAQGHNVTIQAIVEVLIDLRKRYKHQSVKWPHTLYLQLDNTTKQNKGKFLCAFLHILVDYGLFDMTTVNFLPVGHTHIDIDQFFSRYSVYLRTHNTLSRMQMKEALEKCYRSKKGAVEKPVVRHWETIANVSEWIGQTCADTKNITSFRSIRIFKSQTEAGAVWMQVKKAPRKNTDSSLEQLAWSGLLEHTNHHKMFEPGEAPDLVSALEEDLIPPAALPNTLPSLDTLNKIASGLRKLELYFSRTIFTSEHRKDCWDIYHLVEASAHNERTPCRWDANEIKTLFPQSPGYIEPALTIPPESSKLIKYVKLKTSFVS